VTRRLSDHHESHWPQTTPLSPSVEPTHFASHEGGVTVADGSAFARRTLYVLFAVVAFLLLADLHSSLAATQGKWETNPLIDVLAEHVGVRAALLSAKAIDFVMLAGLFALWRRSRADVAIALVLVIAAVEYSQIVANNYQG
jgi:hypothetical protein